jgi:hypothetical protein
VSTDERKQTEALFVFAAFVCLWLSHYVAAMFPEAPGNFNLHEWLHFWIKPLRINWPSAATLFITACFIGKRAHREMRARELEARQEEARWMADKSRGNQSSARKRVFRPIR